MKKTLVVGASTNPSRYAYLATHRLVENKIEVALIGIKKGEVAGVKIQDIRDKPDIAGIHTISLYIGPKHQSEWYNYLIDLNPDRIIFNPGTENEEFARLARENGIEPLYACTLVMLSANTF